MKQLKSWLRSPYATGWQVTLLYLIYATVSSYSLGDFNLVSPSVPIHLVDACSAAAAASVLTAGHLVTRGKEIRSPWLTVWIWIAAILTSVLPQYLMPFIWVNRPDFSALTASMLVSVFQTLLVLLALTMLVENWNQVRKSGQNLANSRAQLLAAKDSFHLQKKEIENRIASVTKVKLRDILTILSDNLSSSVPDPKELAKVILASLNTGLRPLSWELEQGSDAVPRSKRPTVYRIPIRKRLIEPVAIGGAVNLGLFIVLGFAFEPTTAFLSLGALDAIEVLATVLFAAAAMAGFRRLVRDLRIWPIANVLCYGLVAFLSSQMFLAMRWLLGQDYGTELAVAFTYSITEIAVLTVLFTSFIQLRELANNQAAEAVDELGVLVSKLRQSSWQARQRFARLVHGPVQSRLLAAYLKLDAATSLSQIDLEEIKSQINQAIDLLEAEEIGNQPSITEMVEWVTSGWTDNRSFKTTIDSALVHNFKLETSSASVLYEVLREGVNNAVKHGLPGEYLIDMRLVTSSVLRVEINSPADTSINSSNSAGVARKPGYGTSILDLITHRHSLKLDNGRAIFCAEVAV